MSTITRTFRLDGVLTDMTTVKLSSNDETYGVKRNDTGAVVVADNTAMTKLSTGVYTYTFTDPAADLTYTYTLEIVYGGETYWVTDTLTGPTTSAAEAAGTLYLTYDDFAEEVGWFLGYGRSSANWSDDQQDEIDRVIQRGYRQFLTPATIRTDGRIHLWSFLSPEAEITIWPTVAADDDVTATGAYDAASDTTTVTASEATFYATMVGKTFTPTDETAFAITGYTSSTIVTVSGDYSWSGSVTFSITSDNNFQLPDDFGGIIGRFTITGSTGNMPIPLCTEGYVRMHRTTASYSSKPTHVAVRPMPFDPTVGQRFEIMVWPNVDTTRTFKYRYNVQQNKLTSINKYPLGGASHCQTVLASCLAAAELMRDEARGAMHEEFMARLAASIGRDEIESPAVLGYNGDWTEASEHSQSDPEAWLGDTRIF